MSGEIAHRCPEHHDIVLFGITSEARMMTVDEPPAWCPKCKKFYYKWECFVGQST